LAQYLITKQASYFKLKFLAQVEPETIHEAYSLLLNSDGFERETHTLWDFEDAVILMSTTEMRKIAEAVIASADKRANTAKSAFFVPDTHDAALLKNYITMVAHYPVEFELFDNFKTAVEWLNS
jgi:hypothetical protein